MICNLFTFSFQHNIETQYQLDEHCKGSRPISARVGASYKAFSRAVTSLDLPRWLADITPTGLRLATDSKHVKNRQIGCWPSWASRKSIACLKTQLNPTASWVELSRVGRHALVFRLTIKCECVVWYVRVSATALSGPSWYPATISADYRRVQYNTNYS